MSKSDVGFTIGAEADKGKVQSAFRSIINTGKDAGKKLAAGLSESISAGFSQVVIGFQREIGAMITRGVKDVLSLPFQEFGKGFKLSADFQTALTEVWTLTSDSREQMKKYGDDLLDLSSKWGRTGVEMSKGMYQLVSAGIDATEATKALDVATSLSIGGMADSVTVVDALTTAMNAWGLKAKDLTGISDAMFQAVKLGKTTVDELSHSLGQVASFAATANISFDEIMAATAALTKGGISTTSSMTGLRAAIAAVVKPSSEASEAAKALGIEFNKEALGKKGLQNFLGEIIEKTKGTKYGMETFIPSVEALNVVLALTGKGAKDFGIALDAMKEKTGATAEATKKVTGTWNFQWDRLAAGWDNIRIKMTQGLLEPLADGASKIADIVGWIGKIDFGSIFTNAWQGGGIDGFFGRIKSGFAEALGPDVLTAMKDLFGSAVKLAGATFDLVTELGKQAFSDMLSNIPWTSILKGLWNTLLDITGSIVKALKNTLIDLAVEIKKIFAFTDKQKAEIDKQGEALKARSDLVLDQGKNNAKFGEEKTNANNAIENVKAAFQETMAGIGNVQQKLADKFSNSVADAVDESNKDQNTILDDVSKNIKDVASNTKATAANTKASVQNLLKGGVDLSRNPQDAAMAMIRERRAAAAQLKQEAQWLKATGQDKAADAKLKQAKELEKAANSQANKLQTRKGWGISDESSYIDRRSRTVDKSVARYGINTENKDKAINALIQSGVKQSEAQKLVADFMNGKVIEGKATAGQKDAIEKLRTAGVLTEDKTATSRVKLYDQATKRQDQQRVAQLEQRKAELERQLGIGYDAQGNQVQGPAERGLTRTELEKRKKELERTNQQIQKYKSTQYDERTAGQVLRDNLIKDENGNVMTRKQLEDRAKAKTQGQGTTADQAMQKREAAADETRTNVQQMASLLLEKAKADQKANAELKNTLEQIATIINQGAVA